MQDPSHAHELPDHVPPIAIPESQAERRTQLMLLELGWYIAWEETETPAGLNLCKKELQVRGA